MQNISDSVFNWVNVLERSGWTFFEGFTSAFILADLLNFQQATGLKETAVGAIIGGGSAAISFLKTIAQERIKQLDNRRQQQAEVTIVNSDDTYVVEGHAEALDEYV